MTEVGLLVLRKLADGEARTLKEIARLIGRCLRITRGTVQGCLVAGLCEVVPGEAPTRVRITVDGLAALEK